MGSELHPTASESRPSCGVDSMNRRLPLPASDALQKGKGSRIQFCMASLPYFISLSSNRQTTPR